MRISDLARAGGVGVETIRYYQRRGLLEPSSADARGAKRFDGEDLRRLRFVRAAQDAGFSLREIAELIALEQTDDRVRVRELARTRVAALDARIGELQAARSALVRLAGECERTADGPCPILSAFEPGPPP